MAGLPAQDDDDRYDDEHHHDGADIDDDVDDDYDHHHDGALFWLVPIIHVASLPAQDLHQLTSCSN